MLIKTFNEAQGDSWDPQVCRGATASPEPGSRSASVGRVLVEPGLI